MGKSLSDLTLKELWELFPIIIVDANPDWVKWYQEEELAITKALGPTIIKRLNHIGSTSVPGLAAKPTVDLLLEIQPNTDSQEMIFKLAEFGWDCQTKRTIDSADIMMLKKGYTVNGYAEKVFHLHVRYCDDWDELYFRDYLRINPKVAKKYALLKKALKNRYEHDRDSYTEAKGEFIKHYTQIARQQFPNRYRP
ncbi:MAG: GrpB family protein [Candidatus Izemoplasmatales bacterium]|nr:GrpB family protein [Candidatus Izemoplasmatales bacterium]MDD3865857.1 GrpB family protein [Candidatus Izemoplasmatales bacterium]